MTHSLHVSLPSALKRTPPAGLPAPPLLDPQGPLACLGGARNGDEVVVPVQPNALSLFGPRGACVAGAALWVSDTGHHRLLGWASVPTHDDVPADWVIGQPDFTREGRNAKSAPSSTTLNVPTGITPCGEGLAVADAWNHRVLIWNTVPRGNNVPPDIVLGQADFVSTEANRGDSAAHADTLFWPYSVHWDGTRLWVADTGNRRVLMWHDLPSKNGQAADVVLGQRDFICRDENGGDDPTAASMRWPHAVALWGERLAVADAGNNRIMIWNSVPQQNNTPCDYVLGQENFYAVDHNLSLYWPTAGSLNMPYGMTAAGNWLLVADTANSRLLAWQSRDSQASATACALTGQPDFQAKGDNRWQFPTRDSLCWPYGITQHNGLAVVADSGNNRVLLWKLADFILGEVE